MQTARDFYLFHVGHLNMLRQARSRCDVLVAGVVSDEMCELGKGIRPTVPLEERVAIVDAIGIVDAMYVELTLDKRDAWREVGFHRLFKGDDWKGAAKGDRLEKQMAEVGVEVVYSGSLASQVSEFEKLTSPILRSPSSTFDWRLGNTLTRGFAGEVGGHQVVVFVAKEGPYQGRVLSAVVPDANQMAQWGLP